MTTVIRGAFALGARLRCGRRMGGGIVFASAEEEYDGADRGVDAIVMPARQRGATAP